MIPSDIDKIKFITTMVQVDCLIAVLTQINKDDLNKSIEMTPDAEKRDNHYKFMVEVKEFYDKIDSILV
jgi:hypothetical protein